MKISRARRGGARSRSRLATEAAIRLVEAHTRYAITMLPRSVVGVEAAIEYFHSLPDACRRLVPDVTGSAPKIVDAAVHFDLLATRPSEKAARALPGLVASVSPVITGRSPRVWTAWIARLLDEDMQALLRKKTPPSQLAVKAVPRRDPALSRRELVQRLAGIDAELQSLTADRDRLAAARQVAVAERDRLAAERDSLLQLLESRQAETARATTTLDDQADTIRLLEEEYDAVRRALTEAEAAALRQRQEAAASLAKARAERSKVDDQLAETKAMVAVLEGSLSTTSRTNEALRERIARWEKPTPMWIPEPLEGRPAWRADERGGTYWLHGPVAPGGVFGLRFVVAGATLRSYRGLLGQLILFVHLLRAGDSEEEAMRVSRVRVRV